MEGYKGALTILSRDVVSAEGLGFRMATEPRAGGDVDGQAEAKPALSDSECLLSPDRQGIQVAGVPLNKQSSIASLRAGCKYLGISQAGSKLKLFDRLVQHADKLRLQVLQKLATEHAEPLGQPMPKQQPLHAEPSPEERALHEVNHLPYASWCESCVMAKGRPEPHTSDPEHLTRREHSVLSFDFSFTGRDPSVLPCLGGVVAPEDKQTVLNVYDSHSGCVFAIPVPLRRDVHFMCRELMKILQFLGYSKVVLRCDAEPVLMKVQSLLQTARQKLGLETLLENGRVRDPGSNAWVENAVNRVRQQAMTLIYHLELQLRMSFPVTHPLFSWCFVHACWLLNRFVPKGGATPFEAVCGREYDGRIACFAEPILAFVGTEPRQKGSAKWMKALFLTKTTSNDMYVVGIGKQCSLDPCSETYLQRLGTST